MKTKTLKDLLAVQTSTDHEHLMVSWIVNYVIREIPNAKITVDSHRNVFVTRGQAAYYPCVAAHIDSVQPFREVEIVKEGTRLVGYAFDPVLKKKVQCGIGADDKTGIFVCLNLLKSFPIISAAFFAGEECGMIGAKAADPEFFRQVAYLIEYDCPSRNLVSYTCSSERLFMNDGEFIQTANPVMVKHGSTLWQDHPYTDVMTVRRRFPISCLNLSSGYYNWHAHNEFVSLPDVELALELGGDLLKALDHCHYPAPSGSIKEIDHETPLQKVSGLYVPPAAP
jgi:putative aminopeptidase FrvX